MAVDNSRFSYAYKTLYPDDIHTAVYQVRGSHLLAMLPKFSKFTGDGKKVAVSHTEGGGRSVNFQTAQANSTGHEGVAFMVTRREDHSVGRIKRETMLASESDDGAIVAAVKQEMSAVIYRMNRSLCHGVANDGSGAIGRINGAPSGGTFTLAAKADARHFTVGSYVVANPTKRGSAGTIRAGRGKVTARNASTGVISYTAEGGWTPLANDYLYVEGDYDKKIIGLDGWLPTTAPTSGDSFFGVDRSVDPTRLAGVRTDQTGATTGLKAIIQGLEVLAGEDAAPDHAFMSFTEWSKITSALSDKTQYQREIVEARVKVGEGAQTREVVINVGSIVVDGPLGPVRLIPDNDIPAGRVYALKLDTWELASLGEAPHVEKTAEGELRAVDNDDAKEIRAHYYANLLCYAPGQNGVILMPA